MILYLAEGPSSRVVEMYLIESELSIKKKMINLATEENLNPEFLKMNPLGQVPCLSAENQIICESTAICEYLENKIKLNKSKMFGKTDIENALVNMWQKRIDLYVWENMYYAYKSSIGLEIFKTKTLVLPDASESFMQLARHNLKMFDNQLKNNQWISGDFFSICDISLFCMLDFGLQNKQPFDPNLLELNVWYSTMMTLTSTHESKENLEA